MVPCVAFRERNPSSQSNPSLTPLIKKMPETFADPGIEKSMM